MAIILKSTDKTRELTVFQLFEILQQEYIVCELRVKIYPVSIINMAGETIQLQAYWKQVMENKKEKIIDIANRNSLPCIFDDKRIKQDFEQKIIPKIGYPNFIYRDANQQLMQEKWDMHNYYSKKAEVKIINNDGNHLIGSIVCVNFNKREAMIQLSNSNVTELFQLDVITRIL